jgi:catechol 2,3-dioxygenase-like lactoylglutathione lyase family enzyme
MSDFKLPAKNPASPFAGWRGHHVGVRVKDFNEAKNWYVEKLDFRVVHRLLGAGEHVASCLGREREDRRCAGKAVDEGLCGRLELAHEVPPVLFDRPPP